MVVYSVPPIQAPRATLCREALCGSLSLPLGALLTPMYAVLALLPLGRRHF